jgi:hypothetical protein
MRFLDDFWLELLMICSIESRERGGGKGVGSTSLIQHRSSKPERRDFRNLFQISQLPKQTSCVQPYIQHNHITLTVLTDKIRSPSSYSIIRGTCYCTEHYMMAPIRLNGVTLAPSVKGLQSRNFLGRTATVLTLRWSSFWT